MNRGWTPPGTALNPGGTQFQLHPGDQPRGNTSQPDWSLLVSHPGTPAPQDLVNYTPDTGEVTPPGMLAPVGNMNLSMQPYQAAGLQQARTPGARPQQDAARLAALVSGGGAPGAGQSVGVGAQAQTPNAFPYNEPNQPAQPNQSSDPGGYTPPATAAPASSQGGAGGKIPGTNYNIAGGGDYPPAGTVMGQPVATADGGAIYMVADGNGGVKPERVGADKAKTTVVQRPDGSYDVLDQGGNVVNSGAAVAKQPVDHWQAAGDGYVIDTQSGEVKQIYAPYHPGADHYSAPQGSVSNGYGYAFNPNTGQWSTQNLGIPQPKMDVSSGRHHAFFDPNNPDAPTSTYDFPADPSAQAIGNDLVSYNPGTDSAHSVWSAPRYAIPNGVAQEMGQANPPSWYTSPLGQGGDTEGSQLPLENDAAYRFAHSDPHDPRTEAILQGSAPVDASINAGLAGIDRVFGGDGLPGQRLPPDTPDTPGRGADYVGQDPQQPSQPQPQGGDPALQGRVEPGAISPPVDPSQVVGTGHKFGEPVSMEGTHKGTDLQAYQGTPAMAPIDGRVVAVQEEPQGLGLRVIIQGADGRSHSLNHLADALVSVGDEVKAGDPVATVGSSGAGSTGPHLDYRVENPNGTFANPEPALGGLAQMPRADNGAEPQAQPQQPGAGADNPNDPWASAAPGGGMCPPAGGSANAGPPASMFQGGGLPQPQDILPGMGGDVGVGDDPFGPEMRDWDEHDAARARVTGITAESQGGRPFDPVNPEHPFVQPILPLDLITRPGRGGDAGPDLGDAWAPGAGQAVGAGSSTIGWKRKREAFVKSHGGNRSRVTKDWVAAHPDEGPKSYQHRGQTLMETPEEAFNRSFKRGSNKNQDSSGVRNARPSSYLKTAGHLGLDVNGVPANAQVGKDFVTNADGTISYQPQSRFNPANASASSSQPSASAASNTSASTPDTSNGGYAPTSSSGAAPGSQNATSDPYAGGPGTPGSGPGMTFEPAMGRWVPSAASNNGSPYGSQGSTADPLDWYKAWTQQQSDQANAKYQQDNNAIQARQVADNYNAALKKIQADLQVSGDTLAYNRAKDALDRQLSAAQSELTSWTTLAQTAYQNPWLQQLQGMAPNAAMSSGGGVAPSWFTSSLQSAAGTQGGGAGTGSLGQAMGGTPTYNQWQNTDPFSRAAYRTNAELGGPGGWQNAAQQMRNAWSSAGGPKTTPGTTQLSAARMTPLDKISQGQLADTFGDTANNYWSNQSQNWEASAQPNVTQTG